MSDIDLARTLNNLLQDSAVLNHVGFRMAEALGDVGPEDDSIEADPSEQVERLIADLDALRNRIAAALEQKCLQPHVEGCCGCPVHGALNGDYS